MRHSKRDQQNDPGGPLVSSRRAEKRVYWAETVFAAALLLYAILAILANIYDHFSWDLSLARQIQGIRMPGFGSLMRLVSALGTGWLPYLLVSLAGAGLLIFRFKAEGIVCLAGVSLGALLNRIFKFVVARPRPDQSLIEVLIDYPHESFPSGHVVLFVEFFGFGLFLAFVLLRPGLLRWSLMGVLGLLIALVGISRVYLGAHWPSDIVGAYLIGGVWLMLMIDVYRRLKKA